MNHKLRLLIEWTDKLVSLSILVYLVVTDYRFLGFYYYPKKELTILIWVMILLGLLFLKSVGLGIYFKERSLIMVSSFPMIVLLFSGLIYALVLPVVQMFS